MYNALELSRYIVSKCTQDGYPISNLQLQKILFHIQKMFLQKSGRPAFTDSIEAWQFGPVVPNVYYEYCGFGAMPITMQYEASNIYLEDKNLIDNIIESKRMLYPWDLVQETHKPNGAWDQTYRNGVGNHTVIDPDLIRTAG